jgi:CMP-N-acetylneuraminic acid synthetase
MLNGKRILAVVPARGGSKGLPRKNVRPLGGVPLVTRVGQCVAEVRVIDRGVVSTDDEEIAEAAVAGGLAAPFRRPPEISGDRIGDWDVLHHALMAIEEGDATRYDVVVMLQPTSPLRRVEHIVACIEAVARDGWDAAWTVSPTDLKFHPLKQLSAAADGAMDYFDPRGVQIIARQQLTPVYHRNGVAYAMTRSCLLDQRTIKGKRTKVVVIDEPQISIDTLEDLEKAESYLRRR